MLSANGNYNEIIDSYYDAGTEYPNPFISCTPLPREKVARSPGHHFWHILTKPQDSPLQNFDIIELLDSLISSDVQPADFGR